MENTRRRRSGGLRKVVTAVFAVAFIASTISTITAFAAANLFKIQNAELSELSTTAEGAISSFDETEVVSNVTFHKLGDSAKYTITLKNTDSKDHVIESITDDNENPYISYEYGQHTNERINAGADFVFVVTAKYSTPITDINQRAQANNVKFFIHFTDIEEEIPIVPNTGVNSRTRDNIHSSVLSLVISATGLTIIGIITLKKHKKASKFIVAGIVTVATIAVTATVKAATIEINSFTINTSYTLKDKLIITYTDKNGDEQELISNYNEPANIPDQSKDGYTITGWEDENGNPVDPTQPVTEDIKIHPIYRAHTYTIKFNGNGATGSMADIAMTYDETKTLPANIFDLPGRTYTGWDTEANGSGVHYDNESEVKNLTTEDNGVVTLYAQWSINPFHIDYDGNGATSGDMATTNCEYDGECILRKNAFEKTGYHFVGWKYSDNDYSDKANVKNIVESGTITMVAQWAINHYTIVFDINTDDSNASGDMADMANLEYGQDYTLTANAFTRTGYNFGGWNTEIDGRNFGLTDEQEFHNLTTTDNAIITLYAQWDPIHYNVVFHQNHDDVTGNTNSMTNIAYDDTRALTQNGFELAHYKFMGWNTSEDGTGTPYKDKANIKNLTATDGTTIDLYAQWKERTATLNTGANVRTALKGLADAPTTFKKYDGENLPDFDTLDGKVDIALADSSFPVWAWVDGDNIYWWSEAERPNFNSNSSTMFQGMATLTTINLDGLESSTAVNMANLFNGCTSLTDLDISEFNTANVENMSAMFHDTPALTSINTAVLNTVNVKDMSSMFRKTGATSIDISNFDTGNVKTMARMFEYAEASSITLGNPNTLNVTNMSLMFSETAVTSLDVSGLDTDNVENMNGMFEAFYVPSKLTGLDVSNFKTSKVQNFACMFYGQAKLTSLDVSNFNTSSATSMYMMFISMTKAESINVSGWTNDLGPRMDYMFSYTGMGVAGGTVINFENFNTENVTNMDHMFSDMRSETVLDLSGFDTAKVTKMGGMFSSSYASTPMALKTVYVSDKFVTTALTGTQNNIFDNTRAIVGGAGTTWDASSMEKARIDDPDNGKPGYFTYKNARYVRYHDNDGNTANDETNYALMKSHYLKAGDSLTKNAFTRRGYVFAGWKDADGNDYTDEQVMAELVESKTPLELYAQWTPTRYTIIFHANNENVENPDAMAAQVVAYDVETTLNPITYTWWQHKLVEWTTNANGTGTKYADKATIKNLNANGGEIHLYAKWREIDAALNVRTHNTSVSALRENINPIISANPDVKNFLHYPDGRPSDEIIATATDLSATADPIWAWADGENLYWWSEDYKPRFTNTGSVEYSFYALGPLDNVDLTGFDTTSITGSCRSPFEAARIKNVNISDWDVSRCKDMGYFAYNSLLTSIKFPEVFDAQKVTNVAMAFNGAKIVNLDLSSWKTRDLKNASSFINMSSVEEVKFSRDFSTANVTTMASMFAGSSKLSSLDLSMFNTANVQNMSGMFSGVSNMTTLDISGFDTGAVTNMSNMFSNMSKLKTLTIGSNFTAASVISMASIFANDTSLTSLDLSSWGTTNSLTNLNRAFSAMTNLATLDLTGWDLSNVNNLDHTFHQTRNIETIYASSDTDPSKLTEDILKWTYEYATPKIVGGAGSTGSHGMNGVHSRIDDPDNGKPGYFTIKGARYIRYHDNDGNDTNDEANYALMTSEYLKAGDKLKKNAFTRNGYVFTGWKDADSNEYTDEQVMTDLTESKTPLELYAQWIEATSVLQPGSDVNIILKSINPDAVAFTHYNGIPDFDAIGDERVISLSNAVVPTYAWSNGDTIYWWSEAETVYLNENSGSFFKNLSKLTTIEQTTLDTSKVKNMDQMFQYSGLVDFTFEMDTSNVTSMDAIFANCSKLERLDLSHVDTSKVTNMHGLVADAQKLTYLNLDNFSTASAANLESMFSTVKLMTTLDLTSFDTRKATNMGWMISYITNLQTIYATDLFVPANNISMPNTLVGGAGSRNLGTSSVYARIDDPDNGNPGYFTIKGARYIRYYDNDGDTTNDETNYALMESHYLKAGDSLKKNAFARSGYVFTGWKDADNNEYTDEQVMADLTESKTPLELYAQWDVASYTVNLNANGGEMLQSAKTVTYLQPYGELPTPVRYDYNTANSMLGGKYEFKEWNTKADGTGDTITSSSIYENTDDTTLYAIWNDRFTVTIYNGESETPTVANYGIDSVVDLNAQNVAGKQFLYWEVDGAKKSYSKDYGMRMFQGKDLTIRAVYGSESDLESQQPGAYISDIYRQYSGNKIVARSYSYVPDGYEIVKAGVVATLDANIANGTFDDQTATFPRAQSVNGSSDNYYFTWTKGSVTSEQTVYVKAYLVYKDADGVEHTIYGDLVTATLTE